VDAQPSCAAHKGIPEWWSILCGKKSTPTTKANAQYCYEGYKAFQPIEVSWAETMLVLANEFRDGNVCLPSGI